MHLAAKAPCRRRPVSSTLGSGMQRATISALRPLGKQVECAVRASRCTRSNARSSGKRRLKLEPWPWPFRKSVPRSATNSTRALRAAVLRRAVSLGSSVADASAAAASRTARRQEGVAKPQRSCRQVRFQAGFISGTRHMSAPPRKPLPNLSLNRSANGVPPGPRGSCGSSSASRPRRHPAVARLALR
jgi:hypothetical protein